MMMKFPEQNAILLWPGPAGVLEVMIEFPASYQVTTPIVLICHPHPPDGGTMHNKVVSTLAKSFLESGYLSVRFNFRGVGHSQGQYDHGVGELADCLALINWLQQQRPSAPLALAGFSFGAWVALKASEQISAQVMVSVAPPVGFRDFSDVRHPSCPWLAIQGLQDEVVDASTVIQWLEQQSPRPEIIAMPDTSHFFHGKLLPLREQVKAFLQKQLQVRS
jgi:alpha/beta superfamily hydrolase